MPVCPLSTYRLQLRAGTTLDHARALVPYLERLGIDWLYLSPAMTARPGSEHGYDVVDTESVDPELGGQLAFDRLARALHDAGMKLLLDIVPNHMSAHITNRWWRDVLEHGRGSAYADFFDIRWDAHPEGRLVLPILGRHYGAALEQGELSVGYDELGLVARYFDHVVPLDPGTWPQVLGGLTDSQVSRDLSTACRALPPRRAEHRDDRVELMPPIRAGWGQLLTRESDRAALERACASLAGTPGRPQSFDALHQLLDAQPYRLTYWRSGLAEINYRRFFDIAELVALQSQRPEVFSASHGWIRDAIDRGAVDGLRIDHVDGLAEPQRYLQRLRGIGVPYLVVEKILAADEFVPPDWPVDGTTGYEFIRALSWLFIDAEGFGRLEKRARERNEGRSYEEVERLAKHQVVEELFGPSIRRLADDVRALAHLDRKASDLSTSELERALRTLLASLDVYRTYRVGDELSDGDRHRLDAARARAHEHADVDLRFAIDFVHCVLRGELHTPLSQRDAVDDVVRRFQQLSGPVAAKGVEDTASYRWTALVATSEVGCDPLLPEDPIAAFDAFVRRRAEIDPRSLNATSSHDTKRGEDVRARLYALSEFADEWIEASTACVERVFGSDIEDPDEIELMLQTFVGARPLDREGRAGFGDRLRPYMLKAMREAKRKTHWLRPDAGYEQRVQARVDALLSSPEVQPGAPFSELADRIACAGATVSLAQAVLKIASPGVPDLYRGSEHWDLSLVDPDNRRPVDFDERARVLDDLNDQWERDGVAALEQWRDAWVDGRIKTWVVHRALLARRWNREVFESGAARLRFADGSREARLVIVERGVGEALAIVPRCVAGQSTNQRRWPVGDFWRDTTLAIPRGSWVDVFTGRRFEADEAEPTGVDSLLETLPVALLVRG